MKHKLAVTMGDPAGVGPELSLKLLAKWTTEWKTIPVLYGDLAVLRRVAPKVGMEDVLGQIDVISVEDVTKELTRPALVDLKVVEAKSFTPRRVNAICGKGSYAYITAAIDAALEGHVAGVVTGPINKESLQLAEVPYPGHTEIFADRTGISNYCMMLTSEKITCALVTAHVGYSEVPGMITFSRLNEVIELTGKAMYRLRGRPAKLTVLGLNPHAGEHGLFGNSEEENIIMPSIEHCKKFGYLVTGPLPPDTAFLPDRLANTDAYICMYHDQGLIPLKTLAFDDAVNVTLGLPMVRTSVDHGTAFDIAWEGKASVNSFVAAYEMAEGLAGV